MAFYGFYHTQLWIYHSHLTMIIKFGSTQMPHDLLTVMSSCLADVDRMKPLPIFKFLQSERVCAAFHLFESSNVASMLQIVGFLVPNRHTFRSSGGAMTFALVTSLASKPYNRNYTDLLSHIGRVMLRKGFSQRPQLSSSHQFDVNKRFR